MYNKELINSTKGFMDDEEGARLYEVSLAAAALGPILEIGSYCGKSSLYIGEACKHEGSVLFSIDHHRGSEEQQPGEEYFDPELFDDRVGKIDTCRFFRQTLEKAGLEDTVIPIISKSANAARFWATPLSMVFIDGGHSFEAAFTDYNSWARFIVPGGFLVVHDIFSDPALGGQAPYEVYSLAKKSGLFLEQPMTKTLGILERRDCSSIDDAFKRAY